MADTEQAAQLQQSVAPTGRPRKSTREQIRELRWTAAFGLILSVILYFGYRALHAWQPQLWSEHTFNDALIFSYAYYAILYALRRKWVTASLTLACMPVMLVLWGLVVLLSHHIIVR